VVTKSELTGSLGVYAEQLGADRELFGKLSIEQLEQLAAESQALVDKAMAMARGQLVPQIEASFLGAPVGGESTGAPAETPTDIEVGDSD
jgi:predicted RecB family nuclease